MKNSASGNESSSSTGEPSSPAESDHSEDKKSDLDDLFGEKKREKTSALTEKNLEEKPAISDDDKFFSNDKDDIFISSGAGDDPWFDRNEKETLSPDEATPASDKPKKGGCWGIFTNLFFFASFLGWLVLAAALLFVWVERESFAQKAKAQIESSIKRSIDSSGIHLSCGELTYHGSKGFRVENVTLFQSEKHEKPLLKLSEALFQIDIVHVALLLVQQKTSVNIPKTFHWRNANLTLFDADGKEVTALTGLHGELVIDKDHVTTDHLNASLGKLRINLSGQLPVPTEKKGLEFDFALLRKILPWITVATDKTATLNIRIDSDTTKIAGVFQAGEFVWRKIPIRSAHIPFQFDPSKETLTATDFHVGYGSGDVSGSLTIDTKNEIIILHKVLSTADPIDLATRYDPSLKEKLKRIELIDFPTLQVSGKIPIKDPKNATGEISLQHWKGLTVQLGDKKIPLQTLRGNFKLDQGSLDTRDFTADLLGGSLRLNGAVNLANETLPFSGLVEVDYLPLEVLSSFLGNGNIEYTGDLHLSFRGSGRNKIADLRGGGKLMIDNGKPSLLPVIGPVQNITASLVPALVPRDFSDLNASLLIESGVLLSNDITISGDGCKTVISGELNLTTGETVFHSSSTLVGISAKALKLEGKALQLQGRGPAMKPEIAVQDLPPEYAAQEVREFLEIPPDGAIAQAVNQLSKDAGKDKPATEGGTTPTTGGGDKSSSVDESIMSIFRKSANDLKEILESVETPDVNQ